MRKKQNFSFVKIVYKNKFYNSFDSQSFLKIKDNSRIMRGSSSIKTLNLSIF